jgi:predicted nucleotidyltransferase
MDQAVVLALLLENREVFSQRFGAPSFALSGSAARGESRHANRPPTTDKLAG